MLEVKKWIFMVAVINTATNNSRCQGLFREKGVINVVSVGKHSWAEGTLSAEELLLEHRA